MFRLFDMFVNMPRLLTQTTPKETDWFNIFGTLTPGSYKKHQELEDQLSAAPDHINALHIELQRRKK